MTSQVEQPGRQPPAGACHELGDGGGHRRRVLLQRLQPPTLRMFRSASPSSVSAAAAAVHGVCALTIEPPGQQKSLRRPAARWAAATAAGKPSVRLRRLVALT